MSHIPFFVLIRITILIQELFKISLLRERHNSPNLAAVVCSLLVLLVIIIIIIIIMLHVVAVA